MTCWDQQVIMWLTQVNMVVLFPFPAASEGQHGVEGLADHCAQESNVFQVLHCFWSLGILCVSQQFSHQLGNGSFSLLSCFLSPHVMPPPPAVIWKGESLL